MLRSAFQSIVLRECNLTLTVSWNVSDVLQIPIFDFSKCVTFNLSQSYYMYDTHSFVSNCNINYNNKFSCPTAYWDN